MTTEAAGGMPPVTLLLSGDVMTGRGIDQILANPLPAEIHEHYVKSSLTYVELAEAQNGPIPRHANERYIWGDALAEMDRRRPDVRIINLETAVTVHEVPEPKGINYRMSPSNFSCITAAGIDCCVLANNHVLDWGRAGLLETLATVEGAGIVVSGAGTSTGRAAAPAILPLPGGQGRILVFAMCTPDSGVSSQWQARGDSPGVHLLPDLSSDTATRIIHAVHDARLPGDIVIVSIHWGGNWGYVIPAEQRAFARALTDAGVDIIHGHSSHHPKAIEIHSGKPILYGCGDLLNDYEGIAGYEAFRSDLVLLYFLVFDRQQHSLAKLQMVPFRIRKFRLNRATTDDALWLADTLNRTTDQSSSHIGLDANGCLALAW